MESKLLSIIIPTYNAGQYLSQNLGTLIPMMKKCNREEVELIISNNASTDDTDSIILDAKKEYPFIRYIKRESNIGSMANFSESVKESIGKFVFLLGDDDILMPGFVDIIITIIKSHPNLSLIHWNRIDYVEITELCSLFNQKVEPRGVAYYDSLLPFLKEHATMDSMSTVLFSKSCWDKGEKYVKEEYYGYLWYSRILFGAVNGSYAYSFFPLVIQRHPFVRKWSYKQTLYTAGLMNIYRDLDVYCNGIYDYLLKNSVMTSYSYYTAQMKVVANNKAFYKDKYDIIKQHMPSKARRRFYYLVSYVFPKLFTNNIIFVLRSLNYLSRHLRKLKRNLK